MSNETTEQQDETTTDAPERVHLARVDKADLKRAALNLKKIAPTSPTLPVLGCVHVETRDGQLRMTVTDLDVTLRLDVPGDVAGEGYASADVRDLKKALTHLPDGPVHLYSEGPSLVVEAGTVSMTFPGFEEDEFPEWPDVEGTEGSLSLPVETWAELSDRMAPFVASDDSRPILNGVLFERGSNASTSGRSNALTVVATNGHRLMLFEREHPDGAKAWTGIIPGAEFLKPLRLVLKRAGATEGAARLDVDKNHAALTFDGGVFYTRMIEGPYPNWRMVVPQDGFHNARARLPRSELLDATKVLEAGASKQTHRTAWYLTPGEPVRGEATSPDGPTMEATLPGSTYRAGNEDAPDRIGFNVRYLKSIADAHTADVLIMYVQGAERAVMIEPEDGGEWRTLLMPLRLLD